MSESKKQHDEEKRESHQFDTEVYASKIEDDPIQQAYFNPAINEHLKSKAPGAKILDIGCGPGIWSRVAAECGAKSVDGFDIRESMVRLAKQATAKYNSVNICVGDIMKMPYDDNTFDIALSFYVLNVLQSEAYTRHFEELYRVLMPGGTALVVYTTKAEFDTMHLTCGADPVAVTQTIEDRLQNLPNFPTEKEINDALKDLPEILLAAFAINKDGRLYRVTNQNQLSNAQAVWTKHQEIVFPDYYYDECFLQDQIKASGLQIDFTENFCTEERRLFYNSTNSKAKLGKGFTDHPPYQLYHLSKPSNHY